MSDKLRKLKEEMIQVYGFHCWMNELWIPYKKEILTFHHILEKRNGGKEIWENGALLSSTSHQYLNHLDYHYNKIYKELNGLFHELNRTYAPPTDDYYEEVNYVLTKVKKGY